MPCSTRLRSAVALPPRAVAGANGTSAQGRHGWQPLHKKQQSRQLMGAHRGTCHGAPHRHRAQHGPGSSGRNGICRPALNGALLESNFSPSRQEVLPSLDDGGSVGPCGLCRDSWLLSEHCKGRDDAHRCATISAIAGRHHTAGIFDRSCRRHAAAPMPHRSHRAGCHPGGPCQQRHSN
jgi:hypothetical protein